MAGLLGSMFPNGFMPAVRNNSDMLMRTGLGLVSGRTGPEQAALGGQAFLDARQGNKTMQFLQTQFPEIAQYVQAGLPVQDALKMAYQSKLKAQLPGGGVSYSKSPVYGMNDKGETVLGTIGDDGSFKQIDTGGFKVSDGLDKIDTGTEIITRDRRTGQTISVTPKDNYTPAYDAGRGGVEGKAAGEAGALSTEIGATLPGLEQVVDDLGKLADKATYTATGRLWDEVRKQTGQEPREAAVARAEYIAMVDNQVLPLLRQTFGAQFTVEEGKALRATLGDPNKSPQEKKAVLKAFIDQKYRELERQRVMSGQQPAAAPSQGGVVPYTDYFGAQ